MQISTAALLNWLLATSVLALPAELDSRDVLHKRLELIDGPTGDITCRPDPYTAADIENAAKKAHEVRDAPIGKNRYPHRFNNREGLTGFNAECDPNNLQEFPLIAGSPYDGGAPGAARVVVEFVGDDVRYCGAMTHKEAPERNGFVGCDPIYNGPARTFAEGRCGIHVTEYKRPRRGFHGVKVEIKDNNGRVIGSLPTTSLRGGVAVTSGLPFVLDIRAAAREKLDFSYSSQSWNTDSRDCSVGGWDPRQRRDGRDSQRDMDCSFAC